MDYLFLADFVSAVRHGMPCSSDARVCEPAMLIDDILKVPRDHHQGIHPCAPQRERESVPQATRSGDSFRQR